MMTSPIARPAINPMGIFKMGMLSVAQGVCLAAGAPGDNRERRFRLPFTNSISMMY